MYRILAHAEKILFLAMAVFIVCATFLLFPLSSKIGKLLDSATTTVNTLNRSCGNGHPCGTLADVAKTLATIRGAAGQVEIAAVHVNKSQSTLDEQEKVLFLDTHNTFLAAQNTFTSFDGSITNLNTVLNSVNTQVNGFGPIESQVSQGVSSMNLAAQSLNKFLISPDLYGTVKNADDATYHISLMTGDAQKKFHEFMYPPKCKGGWCWLKRTYTITSDASHFAQPSYWGYEFFKSATNN